MFDSIVEALVRELLHACPPDEAYRLADLKGSTLPEPVARYVADLMRDAARRELESKRPGDLRWVDPGTETWSIYARFAAASVSHAVVPPEEWEDVLRTAARMAVEHSLQPRSGLVQAVFDDVDDEELSPDEVAERVGRYHVGLPFRAAVVRALKKAGGSQLSRDKFGSIVNRVHDALTLDYARSDWERDLEILAKLLETAGLQDSLPVDAAAVLADQVGAADAARTLQAMDIETVTLKAVTDLIVGPAPEEYEESVAAEEPRVEPVETPKKAEPVPLWQRFQRNLNEPIASQPRETTIPPTRVSTEPPTEVPAWPEVAPSDPHSIELDSEESQRPLWQKYRSSQPQGADELPATEIETMILGRDAARSRDSFISELFGGDFESYMEVLDRLKDTRDWPEASRVIAESVFKRFQVNIYSEEAVAFTDAVEARFRVQEASD